MIRNQKIIFIFFLFLTGIIHSLPLIFSSGSSNRAMLMTNHSTNSISISVKSVTSPPAAKQSHERKKKQSSDTPTHYSAQGKSGAKQAQLSGDFSPTYPHLSRVYEEEGTTRIKIKIDQKGKVISTEIVKSSGFERLDQQAIAAIKKSHFKPATDENSRPIFSELVQDIVFKLEK